MGNAHKKAGLPARITLDAKWYIGNELVAYGRKPADYDPAAFQGIHARYVLVIIDEAGGVPKSIFDAVDALATNIDARVAAVGTPRIPHRTSPPSASPAQGGTWRRSVPLTRLPTPGRKSQRSCCRCSSRPNGSKSESSDGPSTARSTSRRVLGEFPDLSDDTLILPRWIEAALKRTLPRTRRPLVAADIARFGEDETVIMRREGGWIRTYRAHHKADTMTTTGTL